MASLYEQISSKVSKKYHKRIKEIMTVIDRKTDMSIKYTKSISSLKHQLKMLQEDCDGYENLWNFVTVLNGNIRLYPTFRISGDFVVIHVKNRLLNPNTRKCTDTSTLLIYEKESDILSKVRGAV